MTGALDQIVSDEGLREALREKFFKLADWVRNDPRNAHDAG